MTRAMVGGDTGGAWMTFSCIICSMAVICLGMLIRLISRKLAIGPREETGASAEFPPRC